ncbi:MAG: bacillithiol biosynthesis cysteine-adding enzyme BshC [Flavobacteriales bacterium]|nr:bacillithiol biosynthesis cysteine-adding enzyme BshC [Flavobacteriales bacterium]
MQRLALPYLATGQFKPIVLDYLENDPQVHPFRAWPFDRAGQDAALAARQFDAGKRTILISAIRRQYAELPIPPKVEEHLLQLAAPGTCTVTTGHQLCLFGGPLFVLFKILNTVCLARDLSTPQRAVVPVFWMASEDHDLAEVDHVFLRGTRVSWSTKATGAVGRMPLSMIDEVVAQAIALLGDGPGAAEIGEILREAYRDGKRLAQATRILVNGLFGRFGVVVVDGDDAALKRLFAPLMKEEMLNEVVARTVRYAEQQMPEHYGAQAHAREINLFHLSPGRRARLVPSDDGFSVLDGGPAFRTEELLEEMERVPEAFSPNVLLRPLYQESVLPNIAYVGGGGEVAYWLQLRWLFQAFQVPMPVVCLRTSAAFLTAEADAR